jgi:IclR family transcriptional regulator, acetate operon repressor
VLVAFAQPDVREYLIENVPLERRGPNSITSRSRFREEIAAVRQRGYAVADEEHEAGIRAIGVPIFDGDHAAAALATAAPAYRMSVDELHGHLPTFTEAAKALSVMMALH